MKKHIFGFVLFSFIVASFALVYAFFSAPSIPSRETVKPPVTAPVEVRSEKPMCNYKRTKDFSYSVESANYFADKNLLMTKVTLSWNGNGAPPREISVQPRVFTLGDTEVTFPLKSGTFVEPFKNGNTKTIYLESDWRVSQYKNNSPNFYVVFDVSDNVSGKNLTSEKVNIAEAHQILYVYGDDSVIKRSKFAEK